LKAIHRADIEKYQQALKKQRKDFEDAMQEALRETQKLAAQREEYFNNWRRLEESIDAHKRKLNAVLSE
jgi:predicted  nucleic acid-binding Zn-ribbon protein